jgi:N-acetylglucosaminyl-diphospho-decaprenol L-rhamnosyltransferase
MDLSYCVVNTNGRQHLQRCLAAIARTNPAGLESEILVLDNASDDGSAEYVAQHHPDAQLIALDRRTGKAENDSTLLKRARGRYALLLNEDAELQPGATERLVKTLDQHPDAAVAAAQLLDPSGTPQPTAWRLPGMGTATAQALFLHKCLVTQGGGEVGWAQSSAMLVRREAAAHVGYLDPQFFVYSDETDFQKRLRDAGWRVLLVPEARAIHYEQLSTDLASASRRIVEFHRNRDAYMRKHHGRLQAALVRILTAWSYAVRAFAALVLPGHDPARYRLHALQALLPQRGEGIRDAAALHNRRLDARRSP